MDNTILNLSGRRFADAPRIAVLSETPSGWHEKQLQKAFARHGVKTLVISLRDCRIGGGSIECAGLDLPGFKENLPDGVFVRAIPAGSFEQVTLRLDILHALKACGLIVYNTARTIERTVDKAMTSFLLARAKVPTVPAWTCETPGLAHEIVNRESAGGHKLVLKPLFGSCGKGLKLITQIDDLPAPDSVNGVYYLQRFIASALSFSQDWRVLVIGGCAIGAMERRAANGWITNRARGGECRAAPLSTELAVLAERAARAVGASYAGVDIIRDGEGAYRVLEVNGIPAWKGLQSVNSANIAALLADDLLARMRLQRWEAAS